MNVLLISDTPIIIKIFKLVCKKLNLELLIQDNYKVETKKDLIIIDQIYINDKFNTLKKFCSKLGAISNDELPFEKARDFIIPRPFLPLQLQEVLQEQVSFINEEATILKQENIKQTSKYEDLTNNLTNYVESLADDVALDIDEDNDESIVTLASLRNGGVLDTKELSKISEILRYDNIQNEVIHDETDWKELSEILDDALNEVNEFTVREDLEGLATLVLNRYSIDELKPLLEKLDQRIIDKLTNGEDIDLKLRLKENN